MGFRVQLSLPRVVERNRAATLPLPVRSDADAEQTATLAGSTLTVRLGSKTLLDAVQITTEGPPASYSLLAATTANEGYSDEWYEEWNLQGIGVVPHTGYLVHTAYYSHVTDGDLQALHPELLDFLPPGETSAEKFRVRSDQFIQRALIRKGRRPWLIFDQWALHDPEVYFALSLWANDAALRTNGSARSEYTKKAAEYKADFERLFGQVQFRYDESESGILSDATTESAEPSGITFTSGRPRSRGYSGGVGPGGGA